jgi:hypothetical protein
MHSIHFSVISGAELFGPKAQMAGGNGDWISLATKTYDQVWAQADYKCGGGIYWVNHEFHISSVCDFIG